MSKKTLNDIDVRGKKVLLRVDFNVPIKDGIITDDNRIQAAIPTIKYLLDNNAKVILFSHLGRVKEEADKKSKTLKPVAEKLAQIIGQKVTFISATRGEQLENAINAMQEKDIVLFENTRFEDIDGKKESKNDPELGKYWANLGDIFVNDAFGTAHRAHASNVGIASNIEQSAVGFLVQKELEMLAKGINNPSHPFIAIVGGAKVSDKIAVIDNLLQKADKVIIGGGMAFTFNAAMGKTIGKSLLEEDKIAIAKDYLEKANGKIILPVDFACATEFADVTPEFSEGIDIKDGYMGLDIGPKSIELFEQELAGAKTVVWNGPMGVFEMNNFATGTNAVCKAIANLKDSFTIIGGGDSTAAAIKLGYKDKFTHISTGGGASLEYMERKVLPGIDIIQSNDCK